MRSFQPRALRAVLFVLASSLATASWADACDDRAAEKKLAGAAKTSFLKKCKADAGNPAGSAPTATPDACDAKAGEKKLAGAAKTSFLKKCKADAAKAG